MSSKEAIQSLLKMGFAARKGKGDHVLFRRGKLWAIVPDGKQEIASGLRARIRTVIKRAEREDRGKA